MINISVVKVKSLTLGAGLAAYILLTVVLILFIETLPHVCVKKPVLPSHALTSTGQLVVKSSENTERQLDGTASFTFPSPHTESLQTELHALAEVPLYSPSSQISSSALPATLSDPLLSNRPSPHHHPQVLLNILLKAPEILI